MGALKYHHSSEENYFLSRFLYLAKLTFKEEEGIKLILDTWLLQVDQL